METLTKTLQLNFQGYWHVGSGKGRGHYLDAECLKDSFGLPYVSGKQLKGLLRHAVRRAEDWGWYQDISLPSGTMNSFEDLLFGSASQSEGRFETIAGMLFVDNAMMVAAEYEFLQNTEQASLRQYLFQPLYNTRIDYETGTAEDMSLRGMEVALPMSLFVDLDIKVTGLSDELSTQQRAFMEQNPWQILEKALPLVDAIGANRSRGLGEVIVTFVDSNNK